MVTNQSDSCETKIMMHTIFTIALLFIVSVSTNPIDYEDVKLTYQLVITESPTNANSTKNKLEADDDDDDDEGCEGDVKKSDSKGVDKLMALVLSSIATPVGSSTSTTTQPPIANSTNKTETSVSSTATSTATERVTPSSCAPSAAETSLLPNKPNTQSPVSCVTDKDKTCSTEIITSSPATTIASCVPSSGGPTCPPSSSNAPLSSEPRISSAETLSSSATSSSSADTSSSVPAITNKVEPSSTTTIATSVVPSEAASTPKTTTKVEPSSCAPTTASIASSPKITAEKLKSSDEDYRDYDEKKVIQILLTQQSSASTPPPHLSSITPSPVQSISCQTTTSSPAVDASKLTETVSHPASNASSLILNTILPRKTEIAGIGGNATDDDDDVVEQLKVSRAFLDSAIELLIKRNKSAKRC